MVFENLANLLFSNMLEFLIMYQVILIFPGPEGEPNDEVILEFERKEDYVTFRKILADDPAVVEIGKNSVGFSRRLILQEEPKKWILT